MIGHLRFDQPAARNLHAKGEISFDVRFVTPPFGSEPDLSITLSGLRGTANQIAVMLDLFRQI